MAKHWMRGLLPKRILLWFLFLFSILFSFASLSSLAIVAPFASTGIGPVVNQLNQDTTLYYSVVFCTFSWPYMVKWHNSGIINFNIASFFGVFSKLWGYFWSFGLVKHLLDVWEFLCHTSQSFEKRKYQLITVSAHNINWSSPEFSGMPLSYINLEQNYKRAAVYNSWECSPIIPNFCSWKMLHFQHSSYYHNVSFPLNYLLSNWVVGDQNASSLLWLI